MKNIRFFLSENLHFLVAKFSVYLNRHFFVMNIQKMATSFTVVLEFLNVNKITFLVVIRI